MTLTQAQNLHISDRISFNGCGVTDEGTILNWNGAGLYILWDSDRDHPVWSVTGTYASVFNDSEWWTKVTFNYTHPCD